jgi:hypothetical protein
MLPVLMPLRDGHQIARPVLRGLMEQTVPLSLVPVSRPGFANPRAGESLCRNVLLSVLERIGQDVAAMMDRDVILRDPGALEAATIRLAQDPDLKAVHVRYKAGFNPAHFDLGCMVFRREIARAVLFDVNRSTCCCSALTEHMAALGWKQAYLSTEQQAEEYTYSKGE